MNRIQASSQLCTWATTLIAQGIISKMSGCLSIRTTDLMIITPEDVTLSELTPETIAAVDLATLTPLEGARPDSRFALHAAIYKKRKKTAALIHAQSLSIMTASEAGLEVPPLLDDMAQIVGVSAREAKGWPCRGTSGVLSALKGRDAVLIKKSGALCAGETLDDAMAVAQVLEKGCKAYIEASFLGGGIRINRAESLLMRTVYKLKYSKQDKTNA